MTDPRTYRVTIRYGATRQQYHVMDVTAGSLREAMRIAVEQYPDSAEPADLVEIRKQTEPEERSVQR